MTFWSFLSVLCFTLAVCVIWSMVQAVAKMREEAAKQRDIDEEFRKEINAMLDKFEDEYLGYIAWEVEENNRE